MCHHSDGCRIHLCLFTPSMFVNMSPVLSLMNGQFTEEQIQMVTKVIQTCTSTQSPLKVNRHPERITGTTLEEWNAWLDELVPGRRSESFPQTLSVNKKWLVLFQKLNWQGLSDPKYMPCAPPIPLLGTNAIEVTVPE